MGDAKCVDIGMLIAESLKTYVSKKNLTDGFLIQDLVSRVKYFYHMIKGEELTPFQTSLGKNNNQSKKYRSLGNEMFERGLKGLFESLEYYNEAICWAETDNGNDLALAYANRSAVYYELREFKLCRENIKLAKEHGYPRQFMKKLDERDTACVRMINVTGNRKSKVRRSNNLTEVERMVLKSLPTFSYDRLHGEAKLSLRQNSKAPYTVNCLEVKIDSKSGRHVVITTKDLKPGQIVAIERPLLSALTMKDRRYRYRKCSNCYEEKWLSLIPCTSCTNTMYCSEKCIDELMQYHEYECPITEFLHTCCYGDALVIRLIIQAYTTFDTLDDLDEFLNKPTQSKPETIPLSYDPKMKAMHKYLYFHNLKKSKVDANWRLLEYYCKVASLYHVLIHKTKIGEILRNETDHNNLIKLLMHYSQVVNANAVTCSQYQTFDASDAGDDKSLHIYAQGIYPLTSFLKHSCIPNVTTIANGSKVITYVSRLIKRGTQLMRGFGVQNIHHFMHTKPIRQQMLDYYSIKCECEACTKNFPSHDGNILDGQIPNMYEALVKLQFYNLDVEVNQLDQLLDALLTYNSQLPCRILNQIQLKVHKIMKLKYGDVSTNLRIFFDSHL